jgi:hypothetical protein
VVAVTHEQQALKQVEVAWRVGYQRERGQLRDMPLFYAWQAPPRRWPASNGNSPCRCLHCKQLAATNLTLRTANEQLQLSAQAAESSTEEVKTLNEELQARTSTPVDTAAVSESKGHHGSE